MSNKHYRRKSADHEEILARLRNVHLKGENVTAEDFLNAQTASEELLRELNDRERYEAKGDVHGVDAKAAEAEAAFREYMAREGAKAANAQLSDGDVVEMLEQQARMLAMISNHAMFAIQAAKPDEADLVFGSDVADRRNKPERPARAHPLMGLFNLVARCTRGMMAIFALTRPHMFASAKAKVHAAVKNVDRAKAQADDIIRKAKGENSPKPAAAS